MIERALAGGRELTRNELATHLARAGMPFRGVSLALATIFAELEGVLCSGAWRGKQPTYALLDERAPHKKEPFDRDAALGALATRYLESHGPATIRDLAWWSGLPIRDAQRAVDIARARSQTIDGLAYWSAEPAAASTPKRTASVRLLPVFDEYMVAYRDLAAVPRLPSRLAGLDPALVSDGEIIGTWRTTRADDRCTIDVQVARPLSRAEHSALEDETRRMGAFLECPAVCRVSRFSGRGTT